VRGWFFAASGACSWPAAACLSGSFVFVAAAVFFFAFCVVAATLICFW
jgi:hypothetical protein